MALSGKNFTTSSLTAFAYVVFCSVPDQLVYEQVFNLILACLDCPNTWSCLHH